MKPSRLVQARVARVGAEKPTAPGSLLYPTEFLAITRNILPWAAWVSCWEMENSITHVKISWKPTTPCICGEGSLLRSTRSTLTIPDTIATEVRYSFPAFACMLNFERRSDFPLAGVRKNLGDGISSRLLRDILGRGNRQCEF